MAVVAIHQPNYLPWLGYFHKIALADVFIFLDDAQFSKNSFTNRVQVLGPGGPKWLTVPASVHLGDAINAVRPAAADWPRRHLDTLRNYYGDAAAFREVWPQITEIYASVPNDDLATINRGLVETVSELLGLDCRFVASSTMGFSELSGDDRLVDLVSAAAPGGAYLSGKGGAKYQDPAKFATAGLTLSYTDFEHPTYDQGASTFEAGLSLLDAVFHLGWRRAAGLLTQ